MRKQREDNGGQKLGTLTRDVAAPGASYVDRNSVLRIATALYEQRPTPSGLGRRLASGVLAPFLYESTGAETEEYHKW